MRSLGETSEVDILGITDETLAVELSILPWSPSLDGKKGYRKLCRREGYGDAGGRSNLTLEESELNWRL
jgi:hypothetical protein